MPQKYRPANEEIQTINNIIFDVFPARAREMVHKNTRSQFCRALNRFRNFDKRLWMGDVVDPPLGLQFNPCYSNSSESSSDMRWGVGNGKEMLSRTLRRKRILLVLQEVIKCFKMKKIGVVSSCVNIWKYFHLQKMFSQF